MKRETQIYMNFRTDCSAVMFSVAWHQAARIFKIYTLTQPFNGENKTMLMTDEVRVVWFASPLIWTWKEIFYDAIKHVSCVSALQKLIKLRRNE